jgi:proline racemase
VNVAVVCDGAGSATVPPVPSHLEISVADYHTAGEPFRIVTSPVRLVGATVLDKRDDALARWDHVRRFVVDEPRGHADMYGCFVVDPDEGGDLGVVFFHKDGFSTACGHGTIALVAYALRTGLVPAIAPVTSLMVDVPSGRLAVEADVVDGRVGEIRFTNVPSFVSSAGVAVDTSRGIVDAAVSYGGAFYASVHAPTFGLDIVPGDLTALIAFAREIKASLVGHESVRHPVDERLSGLYGVIFHDDLVAHAEGMFQRNVTVFADGEVDRSPCGSGTSARLAVLDAAGALPTGTTLVHEGITGARFRARVTQRVHLGGTDAVITQVGGRAFPTGTAHFVLDPEDELGLGFQLR